MVRLLAIDANVRLEVLAFRGCLDRRGLQNGLMNLEKQRLDEGKGESLGQFSSLVWPTKSKLHRKQSYHGGIDRSQRVARRRDENLALCGFQLRGLVVAISPLTSNRGREVK